MDLDELQNLISIVSQKKTKCRGNLRLRVLLKLTHDHVRRSFIDRQLGNPENLSTLLRNTHIGRVVVNHEESMDVDEPINDDITQVAQNPWTINNSNTFDSAVEADNRPNDEYLTRMASHERKEAFRNKNTYNVKDQVVLSIKDFKLQKLMVKLLKECDFIKSERKSENPQKHNHKVKKIGRLLAQCRMYMKTDHENKNLGQQIRIGRLLKTIKKLLKEYEEVVEMNVHDTELNVMCLKSHYNLKKLSKKLKKYKNHKKS